MIIRKHSWWKTAGAPVRTLVIAELWHDEIEPGVIEFHRVGLLEYGFDSIDYIDYDVFKKMVDDKKIIPVNTVPVFKTKRDD